MYKVLAAAFLLGATVFAGAACGSQVRTNASVADVKSAFLRHGLPLTSIGRVRVVRMTAVELEYNPQELVTTTPNGHTVFHDQFLIILVFDNAAAAARALRNPRERRAMRSFGLTVIARRNVVATLLRGEATRSRVARVTAAVEAATH